ncbi:MAG: VOC family protein [Gracilimonas sp.]|uniref:VOC family protein n=1 Tax=Gracilimonas TaxID=649462 RepID=UPI001B1752F5|nr:VOC family protein [Gracilimonas sp.]MBO6586041.1 VOC family protein [Gracilimonas sp.]MBO6617038.1 VOC family protein [Gracilimonas sp.]
MKTLVPYLFFRGNCEEAMNYYKECLDGEITALQRFGDTEMPVDDEHKQKIMHGELKADGIHMMFSDGAPHKDITEGDNVQLNINIDSEEEQDRLFELLSEGGEVTMPLETTFWGARYGMLKDKFGIRWMLNCELG